MWVLLSFNKNYNKAFICNISLIKNENYETFKMIINYLKDHYNFTQNIMTTDSCKAFYKVFKYVLHEPYNNKSCNYTSFYKKFNDNNLFFFTNNIYQSANRIYNI